MFNSKSKANHLSIGARGEKAAVKYLKKCGYTISEINFFNPTGRRIGEIDIIARDGDEIVFIEVKSRTNTTFGQSLPEENINRDKLYKLQKIASYYISKNKLFTTPHRFDAISILAEPEKNIATLRHLKNIFI